MTAKRRSPLRWLLPLLLLIAAPWVYKNLAGTWGEQDAARTEGAPVQRGDLRITVIERGNLEAAESVTLKSGVEGQTTVLWLVDEGQEVEPGDLVCELDTSALQDRRVQQEIRVQNAEATLIKAEQNHAIQQSQNLSDIAMAEQELDFARIDLEKYLDGDLPQETQQREEDILIANEELTRALQDLDWSERLAERGFLEQAQLDADRLSKTRAEVTLNQAKRAKQLFEEYEIPRRKKELQAAVAEQDRELDRVKLQAKARIADYEADLRSAEATFNLEKDDLAKIESQIDQGKLTAPVAGMVVYARESSRWGGGEPMQAGSSVRERQDIITIPSSKGFTAEVSLHESVLEKVQVGMPCFVTIDALQQTFPGEVTFKAVLPDQNSWWANPDLRVYRTTVRVNEPDPRMRPGMSCSVEILVDDLENVTYAPDQSVFLDGGKPMCFVMEDGRPSKRPIEVGQNDGKWVEIQSGVEEGEIVTLSVPTGLELAPANTESGWGGGSDGAAGGDWSGAGKPGGDSGGKPDGAGRGGSGDRGKGKGGRPGGDAKNSTSKQDAGRGKPGADAVPAGVPAEAHDSTGSDDAS